MSIEDEDFLVGSPEGLRLLRDHIDRAIETGEAMISEKGIGVVGVRCRKTLAEVPEGLRPWQLRVTTWGFFLMTIAVFALAVSGAISLFR